MINLHQADSVPDRNVLKPTPGSAYSCLIAKTPMEDARAQLAREGVRAIVGPVQRTGAWVKIHSAYVRDPDLNLVEVAK